MNELVAVILIIIILLLLRRVFAKRVLWFYRMDCGHCQRMHSEWDKFETQAAFSMFPPIHTRKIDINDPANMDMAANYQVQGVPFIVKLSEDGVRNLYDGNRTAEDLFKWVHA
jgi:hypothetical protein